MKDGNQISTFLDKPHFDINEVLRELTCVSNLEADGEKCSRIDTSSKNLKVQT